MSAETLNVAIAVDGGGTKTSACVARAGQGTAEVLGEATAGSSNPAALPLAEVQRNINAAIQQVLHPFAGASLTVHRLLIGLAGLEATDLRQPLEDWASAEFGVERAEVMTDIELLMLAGQSNTAAIVVVSGTGSVAAARGADGATFRCGGRGYLIGDEGSGYWIGSRAMRAAIRHLDGVGEATALTEQIADQLGSREANAWTRQVYSAENPRELLAEFARTAAACAASGDALATGILADAGRGLAELVRASAARLQGETFDLMMAGSILVTVPQVREALELELKACGLRPLSISVCESPARAAALKAVGHG